MISIFVIWTISPLINENHFLNHNQKNRNKIIVHIILLFDLVFFAICYIYNWDIGTNELVFIIFDALLLLMGKMKGDVHKHNIFYHH